MELAGGPGVATTAPAHSSAVWTLAGLARVHQWVKNVLVFVPAVAAHRLTPDTLGRATAAFAAFSLCASSAYILNDLVDVENDRRHPVKCRRPIASGSIPRPLAAGLAIVALAAGAATAIALVSIPFVLLLGGYWVVTLAYSLWLKRVPFMDVIVLAGLYVARVLAGTVATHVPTSSWLLTFAMFLFLSLALVKRASELLDLRTSASVETAGRGYVSRDLEVVTSLGTSSGNLAVLVLALYITHPDVTRLYAHHERLWLLCPLGLYWIGRVWMLARRGRVQEDPVVFALRDRPSYLVALAAALVVSLAM